MIPTDGTNAVIVADATTGFRIPKDGGVIPTIPYPGLTVYCEEFQNPEGWGCDSHEALASYVAKDDPGFQNPEGWGCDSHSVRVFGVVHLFWVSESRRMGV